MSTFSQHARRLLGSRLCEAAGLLLLALVALAATRLPWRWSPLAPSPLWAVVLLVAARHGMLGLFATAPIPLLAAVWTRAHGVRLLEMRWPEVDLAVLAVAVLLAWMAMANQSRRRLLEVERSELRDRLQESQATAAALTQTTTVLRARVDALDTSLAFQRKVAEALESGTGPEAAEAALALATARFGAQGGAVHWYRHPGFELLVSTVGGEHDLARDHTVSACRVARRAVFTGELGPRHSEDSDLAAPLFASDGALVAVLTLRGVPEATRAAWSAAELGLIADWCRRALCRPQRLARARAASGEVD